jgi:glycosyltransferase involved in cell wall biosynthesis
VDGLMTTRILDFDIHAPFSIATVEDAQGLYAVAWDGDIPLGTCWLAAGADAARLRHWIEALKRRRPAAAPPPLRGHPPRISVAICTRNRSEPLARCLAALEHQHYRNREIVVIDNAGRDDTRAIAESHGATYAVEPRAGIRFARNRALAVASGDVIAYTDDDCQPHPGWLSAIAAEFAADPELGCCTGPILPSELETPAQELIERRGGYARGFARHRYTESSERRRLKSYPLQTWMFGSGGNMALRRRVLKSVGGFDEVLRTAEDLEMFFRVLRSGHALVYTPAAVVRHRHVRNHRALRARMYSWGWGYTGFLLKVALDDRRYRNMAWSEIGAWLYPFQLRERLASIRHGYPADLYLSELAGGIGALFTYPFRHIRRKPPRWEHHPAPF